MVEYSEFSNPHARLATMDQLKVTVIAAFLNPVPPNDTLRAWFKRAGIPRFKQNPMARRGGGRVFYSVSAVEKYLRNRLFAPINTRN